MTDMKKGNHSFFYARNSEEDVSRRVDRDPYSSGLFSKEDALHFLSHTQLVMKQETKGIPALKMFSRSDKKRDEKDNRLLSRVWRKKKQQKTMLSGESIYITRNYILS